MSEMMEEEIKRWTARRKSALVLEIIQGKTTVAAASRQFDQTPAEIESWVEDGKRGMENALRAKPEDVREQYERQLKDLQGSLRRGNAGDPCWKKAGLPAGKGRELMRSVQQGLKDEGFAVPMTKLCRWFEVARRTTYYKPSRSPAKVKPELAEPIREMIEAEPPFGFRTVAALLGMNKSTVQRIFQLKGGAGPQAALGQRPRIEAKVSRAEHPDQRWATDLCRVRGGKDGWLSLALVIDRDTRQLLGWHLSRTGRASTASAALEQALITRYGTLGRGYGSPSCFAPTTAWSSPGATTPDWCVVTA